MKKILALATVFLVAACQSPSPPPPAPPPPPPKPAPTPPKPPAPKPPPMPATAGALTVAGVEKYMDGMERALRSVLRPYAGAGVRVMRRGNAILLVLPNAKLFSGRAVSVEGQGLIRQIARALRYYDRSIGQVNGYTDTTGGFDANLSLSAQRAELVRKGLEAQGVAPGRFSDHGFGQTRLRVHTADRVAEPRNRRIEIDILPKPE